MAKNSKSLGIPVGHMVSSRLLFSFCRFRTFLLKGFGELNPSAITTNALAVSVDPVVVKHPWVRSRNQSIHVHQSVVCGLRCEALIFLDFSWQSRRCQCIFENGFLNADLFFMCDWCAIELLCIQNTLEKLHKEDHGAFSHLYSLH